MGMMPEAILRVYFGGLRLYHRSDSVSAIDSAKEQNMNENSFKIGVFSLARIGIVL